MNNNSYTKSFIVPQSAATVFNAIKDPRRWWSELIEGDTSTLGAVFYYHYKDLHHCTLKVTALEPEKRIVWRVLRNEFSFVTDRREWIGTELVFEIKKRGEHTELRFTHVGLVPEYECYGACSEGWRNYIEGSLRNLIATGKGQPNTGEAVTESEHALSR